MKYLLLAILGLFLMGCASNGVVQSLSLGAPATPKYSENPQMGVPSNRQYRRMTRSAMEEESQLHSQAGSMWVNEGQTSYLFVQNKTRREGDILNVKLDGAAQRQVETKVKVIKKLLQQLEEPAGGELKQQLATANGTGGREPAAAPPVKPPEPAADDKEELKDVELITTRLVERTPDGNYRVKGAQPFMIGKREYKVIVIGLIRPEDYNDEGVSSTKLLDPQFDVVSVRRKVGNE